MNRINPLLLTEPERDVYEQICGDMVIAAVVAEGRTTLDDIQKKGEEANIELFYSARSERHEKERDGEIYFRVHIAGKLVDEVWYNEDEFFALVEHLYQERLETTQTESVV